MSNEKVKCLIIGSGPAGYTAAIYSARANLGPILYEGMSPGGQLTTTTEVENFPGYPQGVNPFQMMDDMKQQAVRFGADIRSGTVTRVDFSKRPFNIEIDGGKIIEADSVIVATGATARYLPLQSVEKFKGQGVSGCATCDGFFYRGKKVMVVGGGDTACEDANYLAGLCNQVYLVVRKDHMRASKIMQQRVLENPKIEVLFETNTKEITGNDEGVTGAIVENLNGERRTLDVDGVFMAIGHDPATKLFVGQLDLDDAGYIQVFPGKARTSVDGVFAAGDVCDAEYRQAIVAAGSGCKAALECERFLMIKG